MELAMVKQEQGETLRKYMRRFFDKRATVVDVTNKEVIDLFQDGLYHRRTFKDFSCRRLSSITKIKDMITSWADEEDKANAKYDAIRGKSKQNTGGSNNNNRIKGVATTTTTRVLTASASQTIQSRLSSALRKTTRRRPLAASKTCWKRSARGTWRATTPPSSATNSSEHSRTLQTHCLLTTRRAKKADEGNDDLQEPDKKVNVLFGRLPTRRSQKDSRREVLNIEATVPTPLRWSEVPITFSRADQCTSFSEPGRFPLVLKPVVAGSRPNMYSPTVAAGSMSFSPRPGGR
jgi:hypothetical protein